MEEQGARRPNLGPGGGGGGGGGGADLISALPEDLLLQVLVRLRSTRAAARTSLLSRRWRGLWTRLPDLTFRDLALGPLLHALASLQASVIAPGVPLLDIYAPFHKIAPALFEERVSSLLHAAARLSPVELRFAVPPNKTKGVVLPHFHRAASIELHGLHLRPTGPREDSFPALERLSLSDCIVNHADLLPRCPRLRVLTEDNAPSYMNIIIRSASLQEIDVQSVCPFTRQIVIETPILKQLALCFATGWRDRVGVSILAPLLEKVWWRCRYATATVGLGRWSIAEVALQTEESSAQGGHITRSGEDDAYSQLPDVHFLSLYSVAHTSHNFPQAAAELTTEIEKHIIFHFSALELYFDTRGHAFGAFALHLLGMRRICTATRSLKIILLRSEDKEACPVNCPCDEPNNWRSQTISLSNLETVEIEGCQGEDDEFDFLKLIFRCATMVKRLTVRLSNEVITSNDWCTKIHDIFKVYPFVECNIEYSPDWLSFSMLWMSLFAEEMAIGMVHVFRVNTRRRCVNMVLLVTLAKWDAN